MFGRANPSCKLLKIHLDIGQGVVEIAVKGLVEQGNAY